MVPRLFKEHRNMLTKRGIVSPKRLPADVYFVKIDGHNIKFKTHEKFLCKTQNGKMKMRLVGNFDFCINDMRKFMSIFCEEFAFVKNNSLKKELSFVVGEEISKILNKAELSFDIYSTCKEKVESLMLSNLSKLCANFGIDITKIRVEDLIVSKRQKKLHDLALQHSKDDEFISEVENSINSAQKEKEKVFVTSSNSKIVLGEGNGQDENIIVNGQGDNLHRSEENSTSYNNSSINRFPSSPASNGISKNFTTSNQSSNFSTVEFGNSSSGGEFNKFSMGMDNGSYGYKSNTIDSVNKPANIFDNTSQKEPRLFGDDNENETIQGHFFNKESKIDCNYGGNYCQKVDCNEENFKQNKGSLQGKESSSEKQVEKEKNCERCGKKIDSNSNFCKNCGTQVGELIVCPCCGAKNLAGNELCMVCKSKL